MLISKKRLNWCFSNVLTANKKRFMNIIINVLDAKKNEFKLVGVIKMQVQGILRGLALLRLVDKIRVVTVVDPLIMDI